MWKLHLVFFFLKGATLATKQAQNAIDETIPPCLCMSVSSSYIVLWYALHIFPCWSRICALKCVKVAECWHRSANFTCWQICVRFLPFFLPVRSTVSHPKFSRRRWAELLTLCTFGLYNLLYIHRYIYIDKYECINKNKYFFHIFFLLNTVYGSTFCLSTDHNKVRVADCCRKHLLW